MLGFGPGYHMSTILQEGGKDMVTWNKIGDGRLHVPRMSIRSVFSSLQEMERRRTLRPSFKAMDPC